MKLCKCGEMYIETKDKSGKCLRCRREYDKQWREKRKALGFKTCGGKMPREYHRKYEAEYYKNPINRKRRNALMKKYRNDPMLRIKHEARWRTKKAIKKGILKKGLCEICQSKNTQAHHDNYNEPLKIRWLCKKHHLQIHAKAEGGQ